MERVSRGDEAHPEGVAKQKRDENVDNGSEQPRPSRPGVYIDWYGVTQLILVTRRATRRARATGHRT